MAKKKDKEDDDFYTVNDILKTVLITLIVIGSIFAFLKLTRIYDVSIPFKERFMSSNSNEEAIQAANKHYCGDGLCNIDETCYNCALDCGACPYCGDGICNNAETCSTCRQDCGKCPSYCGDGVCDEDESCSSCDLDCGQCKKPYTFTASVNAEPYFSEYCDKINPYDLSVREAAAKAIHNHPGTYSIDQLLDIYDWVKSNIIYQNVALRGIPYSAQETLTTGSGDCKNQAVLIASMILAIGGNAKVVADPSCEHAYAIVKFGDVGEDVSSFNQAIINHYGPKVTVESFKDDEGTWVIFDPAGGMYPGNTLSECTGERTVYELDSCMSCSKQYSDMPYTFKDKCYSECPQGTISKNNYACAACPSGYWSFNNECVTCPSGYHLLTNGRCRAD